MTLTHRPSSRVYVTVRCPSVCLSHRSTAATAAGGFAAERHAGRRYRSIAAGTVLQATALSSKCEQCLVESRRRRLNTKLFTLRYFLYICTVFQYCIFIVTCWFYSYITCVHLFISVPSMLWRCWFGVRKTIRLVKNWVTRCWCGYLSGARCRLFAYGPADTTTVPKPHNLLPHLNPDWFYLSGTGFTMLSWKKAVKRV